MQVLTHGQYPQRGIGLPEAALFGRDGLEVEVAAIVRRNHPPARFFCTIPIAACLASFCSRSYSRSSAPLQRRFNTDGRGITPWIKAEMGAGVCFCLIRGRRIGQAVLVPGAACLFQRTVSKTAGLRTIFASPSRVVLFVVWAPPSIISDPDIMMGKPVVAGSRITVEYILEELAHGQPIDTLVASHPALTREGVLAALAYAAKVLRLDVVDPIETP
ncbi:MAG: DUF433 domain-containing protein [Spirochaetia bacterium]